MPQISREICEKKIQSFKKIHIKKHDCGNATHSCVIRCPECKSFCSKKNGHLGNHSTNNHRNKEFNRFVTGDKNIKTIKNNKYEYKIGEYCTPETCMTSCERKGRAHIHLIECPGLLNCPSKIYNKIRHSKKVYHPHKNIVYDEYLCEEFWKQKNWEMPVKDSKIKLCNFYCGNIDHDEDNKNFCFKNAWHKNKHNFKCGHKEYKLVDIAFVMDATGSMNHYIKNCIKTIKKIIQIFLKDKKKTKDFKFAFTAYRDHGNEIGTISLLFGKNNFVKPFLTKSKDFRSSNKIIKFIDKEITAGGGGDAEAVLDGLNECLKLNWRKNSLKFIFLIADAPPHGSEYIVTGNGDSYPNGCPFGLNFEDISKDINKKKIKFKLMKIGKRTDKMTQIFKNKIKDFEVKDLEQPLDLSINICNILEKEIKEIDVKDK